MQLLYDVSISLSSYKQNINIKPFPVNVVLKPIFKLHETKRPKLVGVGLGIIQKLFNSEIIQQVRFIEKKKRYFNIGIFFILKKRGVLLKFWIF